MGALHLCAQRRHRRVFSERRLFYHARLCDSDFCLPFGRYAEFSPASTDIRSAVYGLEVHGGSVFYLLRSGGLRTSPRIPDLFALACGTFRVLRGHRELLSRSEHHVGVYDRVAAVVRHHAQRGGGLPDKGNTAVCRFDSGGRCNSSDK